MTNMKGHEKLALTNMNKTYHGQMGHKNQGELSKRQFN